MSQNKENTQKNIRLDQKKIMSLLKVLMVVLVLVLVLFAIAKIFRDHYQIESNLPGATSDDRIAYAIDADTVLDMQAINSGVVLLTENELVFLDGAGELVRKSAHTFDKPVMIAEKSNVLLFDRSKTGYKIEKRAGTVFEGEAEKNIITASINSRGAYALACRAEDATSQLIVYNQNFKEKFRWSCAAEHIVDIDLADNGNQAVVGVLGSKNAAVYSKVHLFNFKYDESVAVFDFNEESVLSVKLMSRNTSLVYTSSGIYLISGDEIETLKDLESFSPRYFDFSENNRSVLICSKYGSIYANDFYGFNKKGNELFSLLISENIRGVYAASSDISLMLNDRIDTYNYKGERIGSAALDADALDVISFSGKLFVLSSAGIYVYKADSFQEQGTVQIEQTSDINA